MYRRVGFVLLVVGLLQAVLPSALAAHSAVPSFYFLQEGTTPSSASPPKRVTDWNLDYNSTTRTVRFDSGELEHVGGDTTCTIDAADARTLWVYRTTYDNNGDVLEATAGLQSFNWSSSSNCTARTAAGGQATFQTTMGPVGTASVIIEMRYCQSGTAGTYSLCFDSNEGPLGTWASAGAPVPPQGPTNLRVTSVIDGGKVLTFDHVAALALRAGFSRSQAITMTAIAKAESAFRTAAVSYTGCCFGIWQIHGEVWDVTKQEAFDPYKNSVLAKRVYDDPTAGGYEPWEAYTLGMHTEWMDEATTAVDSEIANGQASYSTVDEAPSAGNWSVSLAWDHDDINVDEYEVQKSTDGGGAWAPIASPVAPALTDTQAGAAGATVRYRVRAVNEVGNSPWSNEVAVTLGVFDPDDETNGGQVPGTGGAPGDDVDPDDDGSGSGDATCRAAGRSSNCGLSFICYMKTALRWAFVPGVGTCEAWEEFLDNLQTKPPFSIAYAGLALAIEVGEEINGKRDLSLDVCTPMDVNVPELDDPGNPTPDICWAGAFHDVADGQPVLVAMMRMGQTLVFLVGSTVLIWRIMRTAFAKTADPKGGESVVTNGDGRKENDDE